MIRYPIERNKIFWISITLVPLLAALYIFFVQSSVFYLVSTHERAGHMKLLVASTGAIEKDYYQLFRSVNEVLAHQFGYVELKESSYVRVRSAVSVSMETGERAR